MFIHLFGKYLVDKGIITEKAHQQLVKEQADARVKLGTIAVADNYITKEQADEINRLQMVMDKRFGDIAIEKGFLTAQQLDDILAKQGNSFMKFVELVTQDGLMTIDSINENLTAFQKEHGFSQSEMESIKSDNIDSILSIYAYASKPYVTDIVGLVLRNLTRFVTNDYYIDKIQKVDSFSYSYLIVQHSVGVHSIHIALAANDENAIGLTNIASAFAKTQYDAMTDNALDSISEFININSGLWTSEYIDPDMELDMLPPCSYKNQTATGSAYVIPIHIGVSVISLYIAVDSDACVGSEPHEYSTNKRAGSELTSDSKGSFVIVDDSGMSRAVLRELLEDDGYTVVAEAINGADGVEAYKKYKPDFITLDITMPVMDGIDALQNIMEYDPTAKVIMISAAGQQRKIIEALKIGASKFIVKPFEREEVLKALGEL